VSTNSTNVFFRCALSVPARNHRLAVDIQRNGVFISALGGCGIEWYDSINGRAMKIFNNLYSALPA